MFCCVRFDSWERGFHTWDWKTQPRDLRVGDLGFSLRFMIES